MGKFKKWFRSWFAPVVIKKEYIYHPKTEYSAESNPVVWRHFDAAFKELDKAFEAVEKETEKQEHKSRGKDG